ncbi:MAG: acyl-CoA dehydrogenase [Candidatus Binatia bacterium]|nr:MAG: acyl-CoA dehydrogenase [Candidatus Binatia bacterium]
MDLEFAPEQRELMAAVRRFCDENIDGERLLRWEKNPGGIDDATWEEVTRLGWLGIGAPESAGGSGLGLLDVGCLLFECARGLVPTLVSHSVRAIWTLSRLEPEAPELPDLVAGRRRLALAVDEEATSRPEHFRTRVDSASGRLDGEKWYVPHADVADLFLVAVRDGGETAWALVGRDRVEVLPLRSFVTGETQGIVRFRGSEGRRLARPDFPFEQFRKEQTALALAEMVGGFERVLERTVAYVKEREQFGRKIGAFQAVQHQVADMATAFTASRHLSWQALSRVASGHEEPIDLPAAAAFVGQAFKRATMTAHHLHGGAGYVVEHPLHHHSERAQSLCIRYTPEREALESVATLLLDTPR